MSGTRKLGSLSAQAKEERDFPRLKEPRWLCWRCNRCRGYYVTVAVRYGKVMDRMDCRAFSSTILAGEMNAKGERCGGMMERMKVSPEAGNWPMTAPTTASGVWDRPNGPDLLLIRRKFRKLYEHLADGGLLLRTFTEDELGGAVYQFPIQPDYLPAEDSSDALDGMAGDVASDAAQESHGSNTDGDAYDGGDGGSIGGAEQDSHNDGADNGGIA